MSKESKNYTTLSKEKWGHTLAYKQCMQKSGQRSAEENERLGRELMSVLAEFGDIMRSGEPATYVRAQTQVKNLQNKITEDWYECSDEILLGLAGVYRAGDAMTENIDKAGGKGCAEFAAKAIENFVNKN